MIFSNPGLLCKSENQKKNPADKCSNNLNFWEQKWNIYISILYMQLRYIYATQDTIQSYPIWFQKTLLKKRKNLSAT